MFNRYSTRTICEVAVMDKNKSIVIFGATQSGKTTLLGYLSTAMLRHPQFNEEVFKNLKLVRNLTREDDFHIGNPSNPINVNSDIILPSFVSLDRDELRKFAGSEAGTEGSTKRLHRKRLSLCVSERDELIDGQDENENMSCVFVDMPGFRQRLSDRYSSFFEGNIGIAVVKITEVLELHSILMGKEFDDSARRESLEKRLFDPMRIWCDYRSPSCLVIVLSQIDQRLPKDMSAECAIKHQIEDIQNAIDCIEVYTGRFSRGVKIPISPISLRLSKEPNIKKHQRMSVFFRRIEENIYAAPSDKQLPGSGTFISCLKSVIPSYVPGEDRAFSMASVYRIMRTKVGNSTKPVLAVLALHGNVHRNDSVVLGPVREQQSGEIAFVKCSISSIKADGAQEPSEALLEGNAGGLIFREIQNIESGKIYTINPVVRKSELKILKTTILYCGDSEKNLLQGDLLELELYKDDYFDIFGRLDEIYNDIIQSIMPYDELSLFWHGKQIRVNVVEVVFRLDKVCLSVVAAKSERFNAPKFVLPCDAGGMIKNCDNVLLGLPSSLYAAVPNRKKGSKEPGLFTYVSAIVTGLKNSRNYSAVDVKASSALSLNTILSGWVHVEEETMDASEMCRLRVNIRDEQKKNDMDSILIQISRGIRKCYSRFAYHNYGGVNLTLIT